MARALLILLFWLAAGSASAQGRFEGWASAIVAADWRTTSPRYRRSEPGAD